MPEGHTIHALARDLNSTLRDAPVEASSPQGRFSEGAARIDGHALRKAEAWGKYLFCDFGIGDILLVHLGLIGILRPQPSPPAEPVGIIRLRLIGRDTTWDLSGPARCELITPPDQDRIVAGLGADPLRRDAEVESVRTAFARSKRPVGALLLEQSVIAGIGNVYRAEILFVCGIDPARPASSLSDDEFDDLWDTTVRLMAIGRRLGRIVTTDPDEIGRPRSRMREEDRLYVYHRDHCRRCGTELTVSNIGGRRIWWCSTCQK